MAINSRLRRSSGPALTSFIHPLREPADGQAVVCPLLRGSSPTRGVAPKQHRGPPRLPYLSPLYAREGAAGQAVVGPLLRGSSPTRGVAPKQHRGLGRAFTRHFGLVLFIPWRVGAKEFAAAKDANYGLWFRPARCCSTGSGRLDLDLMILGPRVYLTYHPYTRARALLARPWSARCYGVARPREGSRQNSIGGSGVLSLRHGRFSYPWRVVPRICRGERCKLWLMVSAGALLLDRLGPPGFRFNDFGAPRLPYLSPLYAREGVLARPWSARCYGVARPREGSRQNSIGGSARFHSGISGWFSLSLGAWVPKNLPRRKMQIMAYGFGRRAAA